MSKECTCHHHACDCREEHFQKIDEENDALLNLVLRLRERIKELEKMKEKTDAV